MNTEEKFSVLAKYFPAGIGNFAEFYNTCIHAFEDIRVLVRHRKPVGEFSSSCFAVGS